MSDKTLAEQAAEVRGAVHMVWKALYRTVGGAVFNSRLKHATAKPVDTSPSTLEENGETFTREPERRGEVINPRDLRKGDTYDWWGPEGNQVGKGSIASRNDYTGLFAPPEEIRLVHRPERKLPTEAGAVVQVTHFKGREMDKPVLASRDDDWDWWRLDNGLWPSLSSITRPDDITGWRDVKLTVEEE